MKVVSADHKLANNVFMYLCIEKEELVRIKSIQVGVSRFLKQAFCLKIFFKW